MLACRVTFMLPVICKIRIHRTCGSRSHCLRVLAFDGDLFGSTAFTWAWSNDGMSCAARNSEATFGTLATRHACKAWLQEHIGVVVKGRVRCSTSMGLVSADRWNVAVEGSWCKLYLTKVINQRMQTGQWGSVPPLTPIPLLPSIHRAKRRIVILILWMRVVPCAGPVNLLGVLGPEPLGSGLEISKRFVLATCLTGSHCRA